MAELALDCGQVAGFFDQVLAHGVAGVVRGVAFNTGEPADLVPGGVNHLWIQPTVAVRIGDRRKKQRRWAPVFKILCPLLFNVVLDRRQPGDHPKPGAKSSH